MAAIAVSISDGAAGYLHRQLDDLHDMIYRRGGIRPVNAAIEELSKLLLLELKLRDDPGYAVPKLGPLADILDPDRIESAEQILELKAAFRHVASLPEYAGRLPDGGVQPIWPSDEPLRISRADVVAEALRILHSQVSAEDPAHSDLIGTAFDVFLRGRYDHAGGLGTHLTPHTVAFHLTRLCLSDMDPLDAPIDGPIVGDPCCGTGRFLIAAVQECAAHKRPERYQALLESGIFGADQAASSVAKARINLLLLGAKHPNVFTVEDSITDAHVEQLQGRLRLILTNPPFGDGKYDHAQGIEHASARLPGLRGKARIDPALAFVARCVHLLADGGRAGIVLPDGLVDGPVLRAALVGSSSVRLKDVSVEANISLPTATFALAGTVAKTSSIVIRRQARRRGHVFLARAEHVGYIKQGSLAIADPSGDDLPRITEVGAKAFRGRRLRATDEQIEFLSTQPLAALVPLDALDTLDPARVDHGVVSSRAALRTKGIRFGDLLTPVKKRQRRADGSLPFISVLHIDDLGAVAWHEANGYRPSTPGQTTGPLDLIFSLLNPRKLRATVIPEDLDGAFCSSEFGVFRATGDPYQVLVLLHHPLVRSQLAPLGRGTSSSRRRIRAEDLLDVFAPRLPPRDLRRHADSLRTALTDLRRASLAAASAYSVPAGP